LAGQFLLRLGWLGTYAQTKHDDHDDVVGQGEIDIVHDQDLIISEARLSVDVGISRRFAASLMLPVRTVGTSIRFLDTSGSEVELVNESTHHRNETLFGLADPMLLGSTSITVRGWRMTARAGLTIPLGRTEENPFTLGDMGLRHQHVQMGTGTFNPVFAAEVARSWGNWRAGVFALSQQTIYENGKGYQAGDRYAGGLAVQRRLAKRWNVRATIDALGESAERWDGIIHTEDGNRGRFDLVFGAGASWAVGERVGIDLALKVPAITHAVGGQLDMPAILEVGLSWSFGTQPAKPDDDHDHGHEHGDDHDHDHATGEKPDTTGLDVADLGQPGEAVDLVPVPGKITVFDFWATWCEPCKVLEPALIEIARAHPDIVAIRRIDTVDWESAAVARHLTPKQFSLPHLKIFDASGQMVLERSSETGQLEALIADVRALVEAEATKRKPTSAAPAAPARVVSIVVTSKGFEPGDVTVPVGSPVTLRFHRKVERTCATEVVMTVDGKQIVKDLPLDKPVDLTLTFGKPGKVTYACSMDMIRGSITAK
jgi:thiol-disulfide isomerase/thioredoxin